MTSRTIETSPQLYARIGGALYLIIIVIGLYGEAFVRDRLIVSGDAAATAANIMASLSLKSHGYGFGVSLIFFGCFCIIVGYLIFRSGYLPKAIGVLMQITGVCYLTNSFALVLAPAVANRLFPAILVPAFIGEVSLCLWLLVKGVNVEKWEEKARV